MSSYLELTCGKFIHDYERIILIFVFLLGYIVFGILFKRDNKSEEERKVLIKKSEEYLDKHKKENEDFFFNCEDY